MFLATGERVLAQAGGLSVGIMSASQGRYTPTQFLLDATQGARVASSAYSQNAPPRVSIVPSGGGAVVVGWAAARARAENAPQILEPGLLAASISGGGAYAGFGRTARVDALLAADRRGSVAALSLGPRPTLLSRIAALQSAYSLVVADLPPEAAGRADLYALSRARTRGELLLVVQRYTGRLPGELLWVGAGGLDAGGGRELTSQTTRERGLVATMDLAPTILRHLQIPVPSAMRGATLTTEGPLDSAALRGLMARLRVIGERRLYVLAFLLVAWTLLLLASASRNADARAYAMRVGGLAVLWAPVAVLLPAALEPSAAVECATIVLCCFALAALSDRMLRWPRAPLAPALAAVVLLSADQLAGTQLLMRSLLGPNPIQGARFYGFGNELKSALAVLVLAGLGAGLYPAARGRKAAAIAAGVGALLAVIEGSALIGAGVGGAILVSVGFAVAAAMLLSGAVTVRRALAVVLTPLAALLALAVIDLTTAHGSGHFTGSILHASSASEVRDVVVRRYKAAWDELRNHAMPVATLLALACAAFALRRRELLLSPVASDPAWLAALGGGLTAGLVGTFVEDSGAVLLVVAVFALVCVASYLWGRPLPDRSPRAHEYAPIATPAPAAT